MEMEGESQLPNDPVPNKHAELQNDTPETLLKLLYGAASVLQNYGWIIVMCLLLVWFLFEKMKPHYYKWKIQLEEYHEKKNEDPEKVCNLQEKQELARRRMQEKIDADAERYKERQQQLELQKRREKIEDWERHQEGKGYRSKTRIPDTNDKNEGFVKPKSKPSKPLKRNDYNPLTGHSSGSFKPSSRRGPTGGG